MSKSNWYEQTGDMFKSWMDAQQQMMNGWLQLAQSPAPASGMADMSFAGMSEMWREYAMKGINAWMQGADGTAKDVAGKMFTSQNSMMQLLQMYFQAWQNLVPVVEEGGDWQTVLQKQVQKIQDELLRNSTEAVTAGRHLPDLWQTYLKEMQTFGAPWVQAMQQSPGPFMESLGGDRNALSEMTGLYWDAYQETFGKLLRSPGLGQNREVDEKVRLAFAAWLDLQQASYQYQTVIAGMWSQSFEKMMMELVERAQKGEKLQGIRDFLNRWSNTADNVFKAAFQSDEYVGAQGNFVNCLMEYRVRQRDVIEMGLQAFNLPTRTELDEAHRRIHELRKELRDLKKEIAALKGGSSSRSRSRKKSTVQGQE